MILDFLLLYTRGTRLQEMSFPVKFHPSLRWCTFLSVTRPFVLFIWTDREVWGFWSAWKGFTLSCNRNEEWNTRNCNVFGSNHICIFDIKISGHGYLYAYFHILAWTKRFFFFFLIQPPEISSIKFWLSTWAFCNALRTKYTCLTWVAKTPLIFENRLWYQYHHVCKCLASKYFVLWTFDNISKCFLPK